MSNYVRGKRYALRGKAKKVLAKTGGFCYYCDCMLPPDTEYWTDGGEYVWMTSRNWDIDHYIPLSRGGDNSIDNLVPACLDCNHEKGDMTGHEFIIEKAISSGEASRRYQNGAV